MVKAQGNNKNTSVKATAVYASPNVNAKPVDRNSSVDAVNDLSKYYSDMSKHYSEQAQQSVEEAEESANRAEESAKIATNTADSILNNKQIQEVLNNIDIIVASPENARIAEDSATLAQSYSMDANDNANLAKGYAEDAKEYRDDAENILDSKQDKLIAGENITIENGVISASGGGLQMFDTVLKDHVLTFEESKGLALQGTYVYKEAVAGSRYGYADFYNKCLEEYQNGVDVAGLSIPLPTFTSNTTDGITVSDARGNTDAYTIINGKIASGSGNSKQIGNWSTYWFNIDYARKTIIKSYTIQADNNGEPEYPTAWTLQGSNDGEVFEIIDTQSAVTFSLAQSKTFNVDTNKIYSQYRLVFSSGVEASSNGEFGKLSFDVSVPFIQNPNGHVFYDITQKDIVDDLFEQTGMAWFYGIDQENERIYLPRNNWFEQMTGDGTEVGSRETAGVPNITGTVYGLRSRAGTGTTSSGAFSNQTDAGQSAGGSGNTYNDGTWTLSFDASRSSSVYGNSDTVQPNAVKKLLYICVGNTESVSSVTDVVEVTTTENDTLPLLHHIPADELLENPSWLRSAGQWNDGNVYTTVYEYLVAQYVNGTEHTDTLKGSDGTEYTVTYKTVKGKKVVDITNVGQVDAVYSAIGSAWYYVINQDDMTFRLPMSHNTECYTSDPTRLGLDVSAGLPNIEGAWKIYAADDDHAVCASSNTISEGAFYRLETKGTLASGRTFGESNNTYQNRAHLGFDASLSNPIYGNSDTVTSPHTEFYLYFKVANAVQNLELMDVAHIEETKANKTDVDGQWVVTGINLGEFTAITSKTVYIDLTNILPKDGYNYMVTGMWITSRTDTGGTDSQCKLYNNSSLILALNTDGTNQRHTASFTTVIDTTRTNLGYSIGAHALNAGSLWITGYRRLGTNQ